MVKEQKRRGRPPGTHPPKVLTGRVDFYVTPEMKAWLLSRPEGAGAFIRELIEERRKAEAE